MKKSMSSGRASSINLKGGKIHRTRAVSGPMVRKPFPIVAIGASAGGIKAFATLLKHLDPDLGMAYVLIMHLSPNHKSALTEIVRSKTTMPVQTVKNGMEVRTNNIYVIPPNTLMSLVDGHLTLAPRSPASASNFAVDYFLTGLASLYKNNAIGVILSGTATDGTLGLKAIKAEGGITFAQDETAEFNGMPQSAVDSGYVDFKLPPEGIARELGRLTKAPYTNLPADRMDVVTEVEINGQAEDLKKILSLVKNRSGVDFFLHYKQASVFRRVLRRMALNEFDKLSEYADMLKTSPREVDALFDDFLINVTNFFRDPDFYDTLANEIFPAVIKDLKPHAPLRIWVAGCATGEEAYSIAISLTEYLSRNKLVVPIQIFASDLDAGAIEKARQGIYPVSALHEVPEKYLKEYFKKVDSQYQVVKFIREVCIFAQHNLLKDPPFSRLNLISCQNVLIYLETTPQKKILQTFHYALVPTGYLFLAKSETIGSATELFEPMHKKIRYYSRKAAPPQPLEFTIHRPGKLPEEGLSRGAARQDDVEVEKEMDKMMLSRFVYPAVVVNRNLTIVQFFGETSPYLAPARGKASLNILKMIREDLLIDLRGLLQQARKTEKPVVKESVTIYNKKRPQEISLEVVPKISRAGVYFLVIFREIRVSPQAENAKTRKLTSKKEQDTILKLEAELVQSREVIRTTNEEYETTYEELQANNEEILSSNEELQSVNEELETSKEELQSANEELTTINEELSKRNIELKESHDYAEAIVETMHGPLLVLAANLQVRTANKAFYQSFELRPENTEGSFLYDLGDGVWDIPALRAQLNNLDAEKAGFKSFELQHFFPGLGERDMIINIYRLLKGKSAGETLILLAFDDFTRRYNAERLLQKTEEQLKLSLIGDAIGTWWWDLKTNEVRWSNENEQLNGLKNGTFGGNYAAWQKLIHPDDRIAVEKSIAAFTEKSAVETTGRHPIEIEYRVTWPDQSVHWLLCKGNLYCDQDHKPERIVGVTVDNTERKLSRDALEMQVSARTADLTRANAALVEANRQLEQFVFISSHDLQEPLRKIQTFSNFLAEETGINLSASAKKYLDKINTSATRMSTLLQELYSFSMLKDDPSQFVSTDLNNILAAVVKDFEVVIAAKEASLNVSPMPVISADPAQMNQLFFHLISNALKFSPDNPVITISAEEVTDEHFALYPDLQRNISYVSVSVRDNGIGFDQKYASRIFTVFQQLRDIKTDGTGIGLAVCKKIVENHRGVIAANGKVKGGATFTVFLPAA